MGRLQASARMSFQDTLNKLRKEYQEVLRSKDRREAFNRLTEAWSQEMGAISYAESLTLTDLLLLTSAVDNRAFTEELGRRIESLEARLEKLEKAGSP